MAARRQRTRATQPGVVDTTDDSFDATLVIDGQYSPTPARSSPGLPSLIPCTAVINAMSRTASKKPAAAGAAAAAASPGSDEDERGDSTYEDDAALEMTQPPSYPSVRGGRSGGRNLALNLPQTARIRSGSRRTQGRREAAARHASLVTQTHGGAEQPAVSRPPGRAS